MSRYWEGLVVTDKVKTKAYGEHDGKKYLAYFENIPKELMYFEFDTRHALEEFLYCHGIEKFNYKSSNGSIIPKVWEYNPGKLEEWKDSRFRTAAEKKRGTPEKYSWEDWYCGHFTREK